MQAVVAQTLVARYSISKPVVGPENKILATLTSVGYLFRDGGRYLYYEKPNYLDKYPDGTIVIQTDASHSSVYNVCMDTLQFIHYTNTDSLFTVHRPHYNSATHAAGVNYKQQYEADYFTWVILPETKVISGIKCQKATMSIRGNLQWVIWFTPKVKVQCGVNGTIGVPGLIVEAECPPLKTSYELMDFSESVPLKPGVFDLAELKEPYEQWAPMLKSNLLPPSKTKLQKQEELEKQ